MRQHVGKWVMRLALAIFAVAIILIVIAALQGAGKPHDPCAPCEMSTLGYAGTYGFLGSFLIAAVALLLLGAPRRRS